MSKKTERVISRSKRAFIKASKDMRSAKVALGMALAIGAMALSSSFKSAQAIFGEASPIEIALCCSPSLVMWWVTTRYYSKGEHERYLLSESFESTVNFGICIALVALSGDPVSPLWVLCIGMWLSELSACPLHSSTVFRALPAHLIYALDRACREEWGSVGIVLAVFGSFAAIAHNVQQARFALLATQIELEEAERKAASLELVAERGRIAANLHDGAAAETIALLRKARRHAAESGDRLAEEIAENAQLVLDALRDAVGDLRSSEKIAAKEVLDILLARVERIAGQCSLTKSGELECYLSAAQAQALSYCVGELALNANKHSACSEFVLETRLLESRFEVSLQGKGVALPREGIEAARGIQGALLRVSAVGGRVEAREAGVALTLPI